MDSFKFLKNFFDLKAYDIDGEIFEFSSLKSKKAILIVNVASYCGYTNKYYKNLSQLYTKYRWFGLEILAFPCNQFGEQEPDSNTEIKCYLADNYSVNFPVFQKVDVNGEETHQVFKFLRYNSVLNKNTQIEHIPWNFSSFLVNSQGQVVQFYKPQTDFAQIQKDVENLCPSTRI